jgi:hypothetical protein
MHLGNAATRRLSWRISVAIFSEGNIKLVEVVNVNFWQGHFKHLNSEARKPRPRASVVVFLYKDITRVAFKHRRVGSMGFELKDRLAAVADAASAAD